MGEAKSGSMGEARTPLAPPARYNAGMLLKIIAFVSAAIPLILFLRSVFAQRPGRLGNAMREAKKQIDVGITIFLVTVGCVVAFGLGKLAWAWWTAS
jgi:hypothetical protein